MKDDSASIAVVGGGVAGLVAAFRLLQQGHRVTVFEAQPSLGGLVRTFEIGGEKLECFYHHLFTSDGAAIRLFDELRLLKTLTWRRSRMGLYYHGRVHSFTSTLDLLKFGPLAVRQRLRLGLVALSLRRRRDSAGLDGVTAADWLRRNAGGHVYEVVWEPLLRGKFGEMAEQVPMTWFWNRLRLRFSSRGILSQRELLGYQLGSFAVWIDELARLIRVLGGEIATGMRVNRILASDGALRIEDAAGSSRPFDAVAVTVGNEAFLKFAPPLGDAYTEQLKGTEYQDALCLVLSLNQPLTKYYWLNINDPTFPFVAVVEHTNLIEPKRYGGQHILYLPTYLSPRSGLLRMRESEVVSMYLPYLSRINAQFEESWVIARWLFHGPQAQPVFTLGAASRVADHRTPVAGLYLANMAQIYPQDRGQNYSIALGETLADIVSEDLQQKDVSQYQV